MHARKPNALFVLPIATPDGVFVAAYSANGLAGLEFPSAVKRAKTRSAKKGITSRVRRWHAATSKALRAALAGRTPPTLPPLDCSSGTRFQRRVWNALRKIAPGKTRSYAEIAKGIGKPKAVRAVGGACGANPIPVLVPCHRVLAANGRLGGFSGTPAWKKTLLAREGAPFRA